MHRFIQPVGLTIRSGAMPTRTTHRSTKGTKLYAKRNAKGQITDIQTYQRAQGQDIKRSSKAERSKKSSKKSAKKSAKRSSKKS
jgi:hypothetical protein